MNDRPATRRVRLYALRHGEPSSTTVFYGHDDIALSERGRAQAQAQAQLLAHAGIVAVYSSDLERARFGAKAVAAAHALVVHEDPRLREMHLGALEGVPYADAPTRFPELVSRRYEDMLDVRFPPSGESVRDVAQRIDPCVDEAILAAAAIAPGARVVLAVYAHNTVTRLLLARAAGLGPEGYVRFHQDYGAVNRIELSLDDTDDTGRPGRVRWDLATIAYANRDPQRTLSKK